MENIFYSTGRRKESTARVFLSKGTGKITVNSNPIEKYFGRKTNIMVVKQALNLFDVIETVDREKLAKEIHSNFNDEVKTKSFFIQVNTGDEPQKSGILPLETDSFIEFCKNDSLVTRARNNLVAKAMSDDTVTHLMFIDNDITWDPVNIIKLIIANKPIVGGIYPLKKYNWEKLANDPEYIKKMIEKKNNSRVKNIMDDDLLVQYSLLNYNLNHIGNSIKIENNLTEVRHVATGFMMIKRGVIEKMSEAFPHTKYTDDVNYLEEHENKYAYALFDCGVEGGHYLSEDWLFCNRWKKIGGKVYIDVSINLSHTGIEQYNGSFLSTII